MFCGKKKINVYFKSHGIITVSDSGTHSGTSCFLLPRKDTVSQRKSCTKERRYKQTCGDYLFMKKFGIFQTRIKDTTNKHITVFGPVTWLCQLKCWTSLDKQFSLAHGSPTPGTHWIIFSWENHSFKAQRQTKRIKSTQWSGRCNGYRVNPSAAQTNQVSWVNSL